MTKFFIPTSEVIVIAVALTPEVISATSILAAAIFVGMVNLYMAHTARMLAIKQIEKAVSPIQVKIDEMVPVLSKVEAHVNSEKTRSEGESNAQKIQIELQRVIIEDLRKTAGLLAQAKAIESVKQT